MHIALALLFVLHGIAHWVGFVVNWRLTAFEGMPYDTTLLAGRIDVGGVGMKVAGILWLLTGIAFLAVAAATWQRLVWWPVAAMAVAMFSLAMSLLGWPDSRVGVFLDVAILALLVLGSQLGWLPGT